MGRFTLRIELKKFDLTQEYDPNPTRSYWEKHEPDLNRTDFDPKPTWIDYLVYKHAVFLISANLNCFQGQHEIDLFIKGVDLNSTCCPTLSQSVALPKYLSKLCINPNLYYYMNHTCHVGSWWAFVKCMNEAFGSFYIYNYILRLY